jgi:hypothetical protein
MSPGRNIDSWVEGQVRRNGEYLKLWYDPDRDETGASWLTVALLGPPSDGIAPIEYAIDPLDPANAQAVAAIARDLEIILRQYGGWSYAIRWATSSVGNFYGNVHWGLFMGLVDQLRDFKVSIHEFEDFERKSFTIKELRADSNWSWGYDFGVYCFLVEGEVVYVGRAAGNTIGQRLADQMRSISDPDWERVVMADETVVEVFFVKKELTHVACALERYLIAKLKPKFNLRSV